MTRNQPPIAERLARVRHSISHAARACGRTADAVTLVAVSKTRNAAEIRAAAGAGQHDFGESYLREALGKMPALEADNLIWHFIGPIQSNKTRDIAARFDWVHSVDRLKVAKRLAEQRPQNKSALNICVQVNMSGEPQKTGVPPEEAKSLCREIALLPNLVLRGLMTIPAPPETGGDPALPFHRLRLIAEEINAGGLALDTLSMGMSGDMDIAIREGATLVRVGTAIFGPRRDGGSHG